MPEMHTVISSNVSAVGYDAQDQTVFVKFTNGVTYAYKGVPEYEFDNLKAAASVGAYLNRNFKNVYPYERTQTD